MTKAEKRPTVPDLTFTNVQPFSTTNSSVVEMSKTSDTFSSLSANTTRPEINRKALTSDKVLVLQRTIGNGAVMRLLGLGRQGNTIPPKSKPASRQTTLPMVQRFKTDTHMPGMKVSEDGKFIVASNKVLYARPAVILQAAQALKDVGALVTLRVGERGFAFIAEDSSVMAILSQDYAKVELALNPEAVKGPLWSRLSKKQVPDQYRSFADCFRTSATVSGINPGAMGQKEELRLPTGVVSVMGKLEAVENGVLDTPAARSTASFFMHALPKFLDILNTRDSLPVGYKNIIQSLERYKRVSGKTKTETGPVAYKAILADDAAKKLFADTFGVNEALAPTIGTALTQVNDPVEKETSTGEKWNFHWAGVIMTDGKDYVTLENCAVEISDATAGEIVENTDIVNEATDPQERTMKNPRYTKQDLINDRWYFKMYGEGKDSFHATNLADTHATPSAITLPVSKA